MLPKLNTVILIATLLFLINSCRDKKENSSFNLNTNSQTLNPNDEEITNLIKSLETFNTETKSKSFTKVVEIANNDPAKKVEITTKLMGEIKEICNYDKIIYSEALFQKVGTMSEILAKLQSTEALDILIDCSNNVRPAGTQAINEFATIQGIINYPDKALPTLKLKLSDSNTNKDVKCRISDILTEIGGSQAESILQEASKKETEEEILRCTKNGLNYFKRMKIEPK